MRRSVVRVVLPLLQRQPLLLREFASPPLREQKARPNPPLRESESAPRIAGILVSNLSKCTPATLTASVQQQVDKLTPGLREFAVEHETDTGRFQPGWPQDPASFIKGGGKISVRSSSFNMNLAERLAVLERNLERNHREQASRISSLEGDNHTLKQINLNQMRVLRRIFLDKFRKDFRMKGDTPRSLISWNDWVFGLDSETRVRGLTQDDLKLTLLGKDLGDDLAQNVGNTAAHEADSSQIAIALEFFMSEQGESTRWDKLFKALYGMTVKDAITSLS
ncbi:hypothetical protein ABBQ38_003434 [Trebouxia sp. C0009 RCD-2024]